MRVFGVTVGHKRIHVRAPDNLAYPQMTQLLLMINLKKSIESAELEKLKKNSDDEFPALRMRLLQITNAVNDGVRRPYPVEKKVSDAYTSPDKKTFDEELSIMNFKPKKESKNMLVSLCVPQALLLSSERRSGNPHNPAKLIKPISNIASSQPSVKITHTSGCKSSPTNSCASDKTLLLICCRCCSIVAVEGGTTCGDCT